MTKQKSLMLGAAALVLAVALAGCLLSGPVEPKGTTNFGDIATDSQVAAGSYVSAGSYVAAGSYLQAGTYIYTTPQGTVTVTASSGITPTGSYQPIAASEAVTTSVTTAIISGTVSGALLRLVNTSANNILVKDAANTQLAGDFTMGQYDSLNLVWNGTDWVELGRSDN